MTARRDASRRAILKAAGIGATGVALANLVIPGVAKKPRKLAESGHAPKRAPAAHEYLGDLVGGFVGEYKVESVGVLERGGIPVVLATRAGVRFRVDVLRADPSAPARGIGKMSAVSVYLRNGGDGRTPTDEERGLGAMALADELSRRERAGRVPPSGLLTMGERAVLDTLTS